MRSDWGSISELGLFPSKTPGVASDLGPWEEAASLGPGTIGGVGASPLPIPGDQCHVGKGPQTQSLVHTHPLCDRGRTTSSSVTSV